VKDRSRWEILLNLLEGLRGEGKAKKTRIMQKAYLDWSSFRKYFDFLLEEGFLSECNPEEGYYTISKNGEELLRRLKSVKEILG
jgi:predicted transcriptional regulator